MKRNHALWLAVLLLSTAGYAGEATPFTPAPEPSIVAPETAEPGTLVIVEAAVPESANLAWTIDPPQKGFAVDSSGRKAYFASPHKGRYLIVLACSVGDDVYALTHVLIQGDSPDPGPDPPGPDPPTPGQKYQIMIFVEGMDLDTYTPDQRIMIASGSFRDKLGDRGHTFLRGLDLNSINAQGVQCNGKTCTKLDDDLLPWYVSAKAFGKVPSVAISPLEGGKDIVVKELPETLAEFWKLIGEKP